jgi:hypothetical protein
MMALSLTSSYQSFVRSDVGARVGKPLWRGQTRINPPAHCYVANGIAPVDESFLIFGGQPFEAGANICKS